MKTRIFRTVAAKVKELYEYDPISCIAAAIAVVLFVIALILLHSFPLASAILRLTSCTIGLVVQAVWIYEEYEEGEGGK